MKLLETEILSAGKKYCTDYFSKNSHDDTSYDTYDNNKDSNNCDEDSIFKSGYEGDYESDKDTNGMIDDGHDHKPATILKYYNNRNRNHYISSNYDTAYDIINDKSNYETDNTERNRDQLRNREQR